MKKLDDTLLNNTSKMSFDENLVKENTFFSSSGLKPSRIDLVFANFNQMQVKVIDKLIAGQKPVLIEQSDNKTEKGSRNKAKKFKNYKNANFMKLNEGLSYIKW